MRRLSSPSLFLSTLLLVSISFAQQSATTSVPNLIRFSGTLKDPQGEAVSSAAVGVTFAIYKQQDGGAPIWMETQNVTADASGQYTVLLGNTASNGLPADLFSPQEQRWLGVQVQGQAEQPRTLLVSVPYALKAQEAETLGGLPVSAFVKAPLSDGSGAAAGDNTGTSSQNAGTPGTGTNKVGGPDTVVNCVGAANGRIAIFTQSAPPNITICNSGIYEPTAGTGPIGILNPSPIASLDVNGNINTNTAYQIGESNVLVSTSTATQNVFVGLGAGAANASGTYNTFAGSGAAIANTSGSENTIVGRATGYNNTVGNQNSFFGSGAGYGNSGGNGNVFAGYQSGLNNGTGSFNTGIGYLAGPDPSNPNLTNATAVGANAVVSASNALILGGSGANAVHVGIGTSIPGRALTVAPPAGEPYVLEIDNYNSGYLPWAIGRSFNDLVFGFWNGAGFTDLVNFDSGGNIITVGGLSMTGSGAGITFPDGTKQTTAATGGVTSWNGRTGAVMPQAGDYNLPQVSGTLGSSQLSGTYGSAVELTNSSNVFVGNGSGLTGVQASLALPFSGSTTTTAPAISVANTGNPSNDGRGVSATTDGPNAAVYGEATSTGNGGFGVVGRSHGANSTGVFGDNADGNLRTLCSDTVISDISLPSSASSPRL